MRPRRFDAPLAYIVLLATLPTAAYTQVQRFQAAQIGSPGSVANAVAEIGSIVGSAPATGGAIHATLWNSNHTLDLGTLGGTNSSATAVDDFLKIAGWSETASGARHAFYWNQGMIDLGTLGGSSSAATGINSKG